MAKTAWPSKDKRNLIGKRISRLDGPEKTTGAAKYSYDINLPDMLYAKILQSKHGAAKVLNVDVSEAESMDGVEAVIIVKNDDGTYPDVQFDGTTIATLAAVTEEIAEEALGKIKVKYEVTAPQMIDNDPSFASGRERTRSEPSDEAVDAAFSQADVVIEGDYGVAPITHCCLESHGQVMAYRDGELYVWPSTQNVSGYADSIAGAAGVTQEQVHVDCQYMGGGFGAKFGSDPWGATCAQLAKQTGKPVKLLLERDQELKVAGARPSAHAKIRVAAKKDGTVTGWDSRAWGAQGMSGWSSPPLPYVFTEFPNTRIQSQGINVNRGSARAWRAPRHPQACLLTMAAIEDTAAALGMDAMEFFKKNLQFTERADVYAEEFDIAAEMIGYKEKAHLRGVGAGPIRSGIGMAIHTWGGGGHDSECDVTIRPDGSVSVKIGSQDLGTGTRTVVAIVVAETLGLPLEAVTVHLGSNAYPQSGASGGSTTVGGVSASSRDAATQALNALLEKAAPGMGVAPDKLEAWEGKIQQIGSTSNSVSWAKACSSLGTMAITKRGTHPTSDDTKLTDAQVGGVNMAEVTVDIETGVVTMNQFISVQDVGLVIDTKTCESQLYGGAIMGITYALYEEILYDPTTGAALNADLEFYRLAGLGDIGDIKVHLMRTDRHDSRGVIGVGEPAVISPGAAISNAVANAIGVRVPEIPLTPDRVLNALNKEGAQA